MRTRTDLKQYRLSFLGHKFVNIVMKQGKQQKAIKQILKVFYLLNKSYLMRDLNQKIRKMRNLNQKMLKIKKLFNLNQNSLNYFDYNSYKLDYSPLKLRPFKAKDLLKMSIMKVYKIRRIKR